MDLETIINHVTWKKAGRDGWRLHAHAGVPYLEAPALADTGIVRSGFSTRMGGVSAGIYTSMNLSFTRGDDPEAVRTNYRRMAEALDMPYERIVCTDQTHTTNVRRVDESDAGIGLVRPKPYWDVDGLITDTPNLPLAAFFADCVPLMFVDPVHRAIGLSHSGWRGTADKMGLVSVRAMQDAFGTDPAKLITAIGPSICMECYEVSADVIAVFAEQFAPLLHKKLFYKKENGKYQLDLWEANRQVLLEAGVRDEHITMPNLCTCCNPDLLFSHRASGGRRGNLGAFLMLTE